MASNYIHKLIFPNGFDSTKIGNAKDFASVKMHEIREILSYQNFIHMRKYRNRQGESFPQFLNLCKHQIFQTFVQGIFLIIL